MEGEDFSEGEQKEESQILIEKTFGSSPRQKQLLKKQTEFELGEKRREIEGIEADKKINRLEIFVRWFILLLVAVGLGLLTKWLLF